MPKTPAERRKEADARKREQGLYKCTIWVHTKNKPLIGKVENILSKPVRSFGVSSDD